ncbi:unnamed protein product [Heterobilharzia americana]|nr:unnamed protein product [Heterobilharzia americana]
MVIPGIMDSQKKCLFEVEEELKNMRFITFLKHLKRVICLFADEKRINISRSPYIFQDHENARKLRIFGYIELFAIILKNSVTQPPFKLSQSTNFAIMLRHSMEKAVDYLTDSTKPLFAIKKSSTVYLMLMKEQIYPKNYFIALELAHINLTESGTIRTITLFEAKILLFGLFFLRILTTKLFLGFELGLSNQMMEQNRISMCNKVMGTICAFIYRRIMAEIISERVRTSQLPIPTEVEAMILKDDEMKEIYRTLGGVFLTKFTDACSYAYVKDQRNNHSEKRNTF